MFKCLAERHMCQDWVSNAHSETPELESAVLDQPATTRLMKTSIMVTTKITLFFLNGDFT